MTTNELSRRDLLAAGGLSAMGAAVGAPMGAPIVFGTTMPNGYIPLALQEPTTIPGKDGMKILGDRPLNAEAPVHLLDDDVTPAARMFVRNNGVVPPQAEKMDATGWTLTVDGEVENPLALTIDQLKKEFKPYTYRLVVECAGNGRAGFYPPASGSQWTFGAVACPEWTGVRLKDILERTKLKPSAVYTGYYGADIHLSGDAKKSPISRGTPIAKALEEHTLIAYAMNGEPIPPLNGFPLRMVCGGWPGSTSGKWLKRIAIRDREHDGEKMTGQSYRLPKYPVKPGQAVPDADMAVIEIMPVKSIITNPRSGLTEPYTEGKKIAFRGHAWAGESSVKAMHISIDFGATWIPATLAAPKNKYAWQRWTAEAAFPKKGYYEVWARATDAAENMQPMVVPGWNPHGYCNNAMHRIAVTLI